ncbi:MAG: hypothetical protein ABJB61_05025 [bacterium]
MSTECLNVRREIDEVASGELLTAPVRRHLNDCAECAAFGDERRKLRDMIASLGTVEAPADFDFKLRAKIAASESTSRNLFSGNGFGVRSVAVASLLLLFGLIVLLVNVRSRSNDLSPKAASSTAPAEQTGNQQSLTTGNAQPEVASNAGNELAPTMPRSEANVSDSQLRETGPRHVGNSPAQFAVAHNGRVKATDLSAMPARVLRPTETAIGSSVFPLGASYQSLKVSVDDGRGSSRTISLPTVSFGSSKVLARNPAPVMASTRDSW